MSCLYISIFHPIPFYLHVYICHVSLEIVSDVQRKMCGVLKAGSKSDLKARVFWF
jgi:hypothetical protein